MKKIEINSLTLIANDDDKIICGYGFCDDKNAKAIIDRMVEAAAEMINTPKSPAYPDCGHITCTFEEEEAPCESCIEPDCAGCEWETCPECGGELRIMGIGRRHTLVQCADCDWETTR